MQFKKHITLWLALLILVSNVGLAINVHYCDNQIASVSFNAAKTIDIEEDCCGVVEKATHCCKDKVVFLQKKSDQAIVKSFYYDGVDVVLPEPITTNFYNPYIPILQKDIAAYYCDTHAPPLFKLYSQYIFYDTV